MAVKNSIQAIPMNTYDSSAVTGTYEPMIPGGLPNPCFLLRITNESDEDIQISFDGVNDADYLFSETTNNIPAIFAAIPNTYNAQFAKGDQIYVKGTTGTGHIFVAGYYVSQGG